LNNEDEENVWLSLRTVTKGETQKLEKKEKFVEKYCIHWKALEEL
jgi:hypothetical protein